MATPYVSVAIIGSGATAMALISFLKKHPKMKIRVWASVTRTSLEKELRHKGIVYRCLNEVDIPRKCDVAFACGTDYSSMKALPVLRENGKKCVDISGAYRMNASLLEEWYGFSNEDQENFADAAYGLPEINREKIQRTSLVANAGSYSTAVILGLFPAIKNQLIQERSKIIIRAEGGRSCAGSNPRIFEEYGSRKFAEDCRKRHTPEILEALNKETTDWEYPSRENLDLKTSLNCSLERGILAVTTFRLEDGKTAEDVRQYYHDAYATEPFIHFSDSHPRPEELIDTNHCIISLNSIGHREVRVATAIDNLGKGAAGQAIQNMNLMLGFPETLGILELSD